MKRDIQMDMCNMLTIIWITITLVQISSRRKCRFVVRLVLEIHHSLNCPEEVTYENNILNIITQEKKESLKTYIDHFTKVVVEVGGSDKILKHWIFENGLWQDNAFEEKLSHKVTQNSKELFNKENA